MQDFSLLGEGIDLEDETPPLVSPEARAMQKVLHYASDREFEDWERLALRRVAKMVLAFDALGSAAKAIQRGLILIGSVVAFWAALKSGLIEWIRQAIQ